MSISDRQLDTLLLELIERCPHDLGQSLGKGLVMEICEWIERHQDGRRPDWSAAVDLLGICWNHLPCAYPSPDVRPPDPAELRAFARRMFTGISELLSEKPDGGPLPPNPYHVTRHNDTITLFGQTATHHSPDDALLLAVWIIALADPALEKAPALLLRVATRQ